MLDATSKFALQVEALAAAGLSGAAALGMRDLEHTFSLPVPELLAAAAGAFLVLSFLPPRRDAEGRLTGRLRMLGTVIFCTLAATWFGPSLATWLGWAAQVHLGVAFLLAAAGQVVIPLAIEHRQEIWKRL